MTDATTLRVPGKLWTVNAERRMHWSRRARLTKEMREAGWGIALAYKAPRLSKALVTVTPHQSKRGPLADSHAFYPAVKACVDGLVDARVIPNDTQDCLELVVKPNVRDEWEGLEVEIRG